MWTSLFQTKVFMFGLLLIYSVFIAEHVVSSQGISAGNQHTCSYSSYGAMYCWGINNNGQLGDGTTTMRRTITSVSGMNYGVSAIAASTSHTCGVKMGVAYCWGNNFNGRLGDGSTTTRTSPVAVVGINSSVVSIAAGEAHTCALTSMGAMYCWGYNYYGQLGIGHNMSTTVYSTAQSVWDMTDNVTAIAAGFHQSCAIQSAKLFCWGYNFNGQLGDGSITSKSVPVEVSSLSWGVKAIAMGRFHTCAITIEEALYCWGNNGVGQLGMGTTTPSVELTPIAVPDLASNVTSVSLSWQNSCAIKAGRVLCWGANSNGQIGDGTYVTRYSPVHVSGQLVDVAMVAVGRFHACVSTLFDSLYCWGYNNVGQLGDDVDYTIYQPVGVVGMEAEVYQVDAGGYHTCALHASMGLLCWGNNGNFQVSSSSDVLRYFTPEFYLDAPQYVTAITTGFYHTCAIAMWGSVYCWGTNGNGQLGDGTTTQRATPTLVANISSEVSAVVAGNSYTCAISVIGKLYCWGNNGNGQLGLGYVSSIVSTPQEVLYLTDNVTAVSTCSYHTCALLNESLYCWGYNSYGQLGVGYTSNQEPIPLYVSRNVSSVSNGAYSTCVIVTTGELYCWGYNYYGQLGDNSTTDRWSPTMVVGMSEGVTAVSCSENHACAIQFGSLYCWGNNGNGQLGDGSKTRRLVPIAVLGMENTVISVSTGALHTCAIREQGSLYCWGYNLQGQVGDGSVTTRTSPYLIAFAPTPQPTSQPTSIPSGQPSQQPSTAPTGIPSSQPSTQPSFIPSAQPSSQPSFTPSSQPSSQPSMRPSVQPSNIPSADPTSQPSSQPTMQPYGSPTTQPSSQPSSSPSNQPSHLPSVQPSTHPTTRPSSQPSKQPSLQPYGMPSGQPSFQPSSIPSNQPSHLPSMQPSSQPTVVPSSQPTMQPYSTPTAQPSPQPSSIPSNQPSHQPSMQPSSQPTAVPSSQPTMQPYSTPTAQPSFYPSCRPSMRPSSIPTGVPSLQPYASPTSRPVSYPSSIPSTSPSTQPSMIPSSQPSSIPSIQPSILPSSFPTGQPTHQPSEPSTYTSFPFFNMSAKSGVLLSDLATVDNLLGFSNLSDSQSLSFVSSLLKATLSRMSFPPRSDNSSFSNSTSSPIMISIPIPASSSTISLSLTSDFSSSESMNVLVSVMELSASLFGENLFTNPHNTNSTTTQSSSIGLPVLVSDVISISLVVAPTSNVSQSRAILPSFETGLMLDSSTVALNDEFTRLVHNCTLGVKESVSVLCPSSQVWLNMTCTGRGEAMVRRSCPVFRHVCGVLNLADNSIASTDYCETISTGLSSVVCRCGYNSEVNRNVSSSMLLLNGRVSVAAVGSFASSKLDYSALPVAAAISGNAVTQSVLVLVTFGLLWILGGFCLGAILNSSPNSKNRVMASSVTASSARTDICESTYLYLRSTLPPACQSDRWWIDVWVQTLLRRHKLICVIYTFFINMSFQGSSFSGILNHETESAMRHQLLDVFYVVTALTLSLFSLAVFYDLQSPVDDGYCGQWTEATTCLSTKTLLDETIHKCLWIESVVDDHTAAVVTESYVSGNSIISATKVTSLQSALAEDIASPCVLNTDTLSSRAYLLTFLITSAFSLVVIYMLDAIFDVITFDNAVHKAEDGTIGKVKSQSKRLEWTSVLPTSIVIPQSIGVIDKHSFPLVPAEVRHARMVWLNSLVTEDKIILRKNVSNEMRLIHEFLWDTMSKLNDNILNDSDKKQEEYLWKWTVHHWFGAETQSWSLHWQYVLCLWLLMLHGGAMYFLLAKAAMRGYGWQIAFFQATLWEVILDAGLVMPMEIIVLDYLIPVIGLYNIRDPLIAILKHICCTTSFALPWKSYANRHTNESESITESKNSACRTKKPASGYFSNVLIQNNTSSPEETIIEALTATRDKLNYAQFKLRSNDYRWPLDLYQSCLSICRKCILYGVYYISPAVLETVVKLVSTFAATFLVFLALFVIRPLLRQYFSSGHSIGLVTLSWLMAGSPIIVFLLYVLREVLYRQLRTSGRIIDDIAWIENANVTHNINHSDNESFAHENCVLESPISSDIVWSSEEGDISDIEDCFQDELNVWLSASLSSIAESECV